MDAEDFYRVVFSPILTKSFQNFQTQLLKFRDFLRASLKDRGKTSFSFDLRVEKETFDHGEVVLRELQDYCGTYSSFLKNGGPEKFKEIFPILNLDDIDFDKNPFERIYISSIHDFLIARNPEFPSMIQCEYIMQSYTDFLDYMSIQHAANQTANSDICSLLKFVGPFLKV